MPGGREPHRLVKREGGGNHVSILACFTTPASPEVGGYPYSYWDFFLIVLFVRFLGLS